MINPLIEMAGCFISLGKEKRPLFTRRTASLILAAIVIVAGCFADPDAPKDLTFITPAPSATFAVVESPGALESAGKTARPGAVETAAPSPSGTVMQFESAAVYPLAGVWSFDCPAFSVTQPGKSGKWFNDETAGTCKLTVVHQGEDYSLGAAAGALPNEVTLDQGAVKITLEDKTSYRLSGTLTGDSIVGEMHLVQLGVVYDGPWNATRVE